MHDRVFCNSLFAVPPQRLTRIWVDIKARKIAAGNIHPDAVFFLEDVGRGKGRYLNFIINRVRVKTTTFCRQTIWLLLRRQLLRPAIHAKCRSIRFDPLPRYCGHSVLRLIPSLSSITANLGSSRTPSKNGSPTSHHKAVSDRAIALSSQ